MTDGPTNEELLRLIADLEYRVAALETRSVSSKGKPAGDDPMFDDFWAVWPKKVNKGNARKAWALIPTATRCTVLSKASEYGAIYENATEDQLKFVPYPASWLNAHGWEDDPRVWRLNFASHAPGAARKSSTQLPLIGKGETVLTKEQRDALAKAQEERAVAERNDLVKRLKAAGKLPRDYPDGSDERGPF